MKTVKCDFCERTYAHRSSLNEHIQNKHPEQHKKKEKSYECADCKKKFTSLRGIYAHQKRGHGENSKFKNKENRFNCEGCTRSFNTLKNFRYHVRMRHKELALKLVERTPHPEETKKKCAHCFNTYMSLQGLQKHLKRVHGQDQCFNKQALEIMKKNFKSLEEFEEWKERQEDEDQTRYSLKYSTQYSAYKTLYFKCFRNGTYRPSGRNIRNLKAKGSCKSGTKCPSAIVAKYFNEGSVEVKFFPTHSNHGSSVNHLYLRKTEKTFIASLIQSGMSFEEILSTLKNKGINYKSVQRKDLANIARSFQLEGVVQQTENNPLSLEAFIKRSQQDSENLFLYCKLPGQTCRFGLSSEDLLIVMGDPMQVEEGKKFLKEGRMVCVDSIKGLNPSDVHLTSLLVFDKQENKVFPALFCFSSKFDLKSLQIFFKFFREKMEENTNDLILMTEDDPILEKAWREEVSNDCQFFFTKWHLQKVWKQNIFKKISGREKEKEKIMKKLLEISEIDSEVEFLSCLDDLLQDLHCREETRDLGTYLEKEFASRVESWAWCYRKGLPPGLDIALEQMHKTLKKRKLKKLDQAISSILKYVEDLLVGQSLSSRERKWSRHKIKQKRESLPHHNHKRTVEQSFQVKSKQGIFTVNRNRLSLENKNSSNIFTCKCEEFKKKRIICNHIQFVLKHIEQNERSKKEEKEINKFLDEEYNEEKYEKELKNFENKKKILEKQNEKKNEIKKEIFELFNKLEEFELEKQLKSLSEVKETLKREMVLF